MKKILSNKKELIGMIHLPPSLGFKGHPGLGYCIKKSIKDLKTLEKAGFDAVLIENDDDKPSTEFANPAQIANFAIVAYELSKLIKIPMGIEVMLNDWRASIDIAKLVGAHFVRIDVFVDHVTSKWGEIKPDTKEIIAYKNKIYPELVLLTDIQVKHKKMLENKTLLESAKQAIDSGSNGIILSGDLTGHETPIDDIVKVKNKNPDFPVIIGSGLSSDNILDQLSVADAAIVGTSIKVGDSIDFAKAKELVEKLKKIK